MQNVIYFDITDGPSKDTIFDVFKYYFGGKIDICFRLSESNIQPFKDYCSKIANLGTPNAIADQSFFIEAIEYIKTNAWDEKRGRVIRLKGDCDLFYLDTNGCTSLNSRYDGRKGAYHVDFRMVYDTESRQGQMRCYDFRDCYLDPYE